MIKFLDLHAQYMGIKDEIDFVINDVISKSIFIGGEYLDRFEQEFSTYIDTRHCVGVGNGTDALEIAIHALNLPKNSEIIVPANSFIASSEAVTRNGHKVVFCDVDKDNFTIDINKLEQYVSKSTAAIIAVHLYGQPCDVDGLNDIAKKYGLRIIEDCAQAHGATYKNKKVGTYGDISAFSFYPGKLLGAYGDGGAILTDDVDLANKCRTHANHGRTSKYDHVVEGRNSRLDNLQAAILSVKLKYLDDWIKVRRHVAEKYSKDLSTIVDIELPREIDNSRHAYHLYVIKHPRRDDLMSYLKNAGIACGLHYPVTLPNSGAYSDQSSLKNCVVAEQLSSRIMSLPIGEHMNDEMVDEVIAGIISY